MEARDFARKCFENIAFEPTATEESGELATAGLQFVVGEGINWAVVKFDRTRLLVERIEETSRGRV